MEEKMALMEKSYELAAKYNNRQALEENNFGFTLTLTDEDDNSISVTLPMSKLV